MCGYQLFAHWWLYFDLAQTSIHRCEVSTVDFNKDAKTKLGSFSTIVKSESQLTKVFRFPDTDLFITTSVLYMPKSPYSEGAQPSEAILTVLIGRKGYSEIETEMKDSEVISNARAVVPLKSFEKAEVETIFLGRRQPVVALECTK
jgi:hypothetical protein